MRRLARLVLRRREKPVKAKVSTRPKLLIFDFDGTIGDTFADGFEILNKLAVEFGFRQLSREDIPKARDMRTRQLMKFLGIPTTKMSRIAHRGSQELTSRIQTVKPCEGVPEVLRELHRDGYLLGIVTSNTESNVQTFLRNHDLEIFDFIRCSSKLLGKAREIRIALKLQKMLPEDVLFVGDETRDVEAATKTHIRMAAVTWGYNSRTALEGLKPDFVFERPEEFLSFLRTLPPQETNQS